MKEEELISRAKKEHIKINLLKFLENAIYK